MVGGDGQVEKGLERCRQGSRYGRRGLPGLSSHHGPLWYSQSALLPDGASIPLSLGLHSGKGWCPGQRAVPSVPLGHVGVGTMHCLDMFPERAGISVAFGAARELTHIRLLLSGE